jgi:hypothetical protein
LKYFSTGNRARTSAGTSNLVANGRRTERVQWMTQADIDRYANFEPNPWPKVSEILRAA